MNNILHIIHLERRLDRLESLQKQMELQKINFLLCDGVEDNKKKVEECINIAHKNVVRKAKEKDYPYVIIAEDDIQFAGTGAWDYFLKNIPSDFDMYFGMIYSGNVDHENRITHGYSGHTIYCVHQRFYDTYLSVPDNTNLDIALGEMAHQYKYYVCDPFIAYQAAGYSDRMKFQWSFDNDNLIKPLLNN